MDKSKATEKWFMFAISVPFSCYVHHVPINHYFDTVQVSKAGEERYTYKSKAIETRN